MCGTQDEKIHCGLHFWAIYIYQILAESLGVQTLTYMFTPHEIYADGLNFLWPRQYPKKEECYIQQPLFFTTSPARLFIVRFVIDCKEIDTELTTFRGAAMDLRWV